MEQLEGRDILRPVFIPTGYDEITLDNIVCRVFVYLLSMFNLELTPKASRVKLLSWWDLWGFHVRNWCLRYYQLSISQITNLL